MRQGNKLNIAVAVGAALLCIGIVGVTLLLVQERGEVAQATQELGLRESELAQARTELQQALNQPDARVPALEQARQQLERQNRELSSYIQTLEGERDDLNSRVQALEQGRISLRTFLSGIDRRASASAETAPATGEVTLDPSPGVEDAPAQSPEPGQSGPPGGGAALVAENRSLKAQISRLEGEVGRLQQSNRAAGTAGGSATGPTTGPTIGLEAREAELRSLIASLEQKEAGLNAAIASLEQSEAGLNAAIASLEQQESGLRAVIASLEDDRKALAVQANEMFPVCSGSMEPKITCLDTVVLLENFLPQDIQVGTVISFIPPPEEGQESGDASPVLHRVADIKREDGIYHFWPKGDAWADPDGYWVPQTSDVGYVIELLPGTRQQNADLRNFVNRAREQYVAARGRMVEARDRYDETAVANCGSVEAVASCQTTEEGFGQVSSTYNQFTQAWNGYVAAVCEYDRAYFHGLHDSEPKETREITPYTAPAQCTGSG